MSKAFEFLKVYCLLLVAGMLTMVALHLPGWLRGVDNFQAAAQIAAGNSATASASMTTAADTFNMTSTEMLDVVGTMNTTLTRLNEGLNGTTGTVSQTNTVLAKADKVLDSTKDLEDTAKGKVAALGDQTVATMDNFDTQVNRLMDGLKPSVDRIPGMMDSGKIALESSSFALTKAGNLMESSQPFMTNMGKLSGDAYVKLHPFLNPDHVNHGFWYKSGSALYGVINTTIPVGELVYYWRQGVK